MLQFTVYESMKWPVAGCNIGYVLERKLKIKKFFKRANGMKWRCAAKMGNKSELILRLPKFQQIVLFSMW